MPSTLTVDRNSTEDAQQREIIVKLDGEQIAQLAYGQSITKEIPAGPHTLLVDNTWNKKSVVFSAVEGDSIRFLAKNTSSRFSEFLLMIFGAAPIRVSLDRQ
ncbi:MAG: hypothetical protein JSS69_13180 [Acidobacteria bacterium]|nr:hypothetical protein [Acidobacteriota bacterium]MBS1866861.1 hypothetical protein [Acidobacteriota bacterium]